MMRFLRALVSAALVPLARSAVVPRQIPINYDAVIVGGGPAGLSALSGLARVRRASARAWNHRASEVVVRNLYGGIHHVSTCQWMWKEK
ncbi:hypothetical protein N656DRAFT_785239 [Canariomyces notabilis]|uniref:Thioredoxin reductase n=1 Tax=Canariomyces notabilis TaxID=2074819 RepID=A0AAN6T871_9PEZI|nr:hypothetical protein N656DRAFT_785239 [Canariomyces arenarius]